MKNRVTKRFLIFSIFSTFLVIFFSSIIIVVIYSGRGADLSSPRSMTLLFDQHIVDNNGNFGLDNFGKEYLIKSSAWLQILDENGKEVYSYNRPNNVLTKYSPFEIIDSYLYTRLGFSNFVSSYGKYTIYTGFPASDYTKIVIDTTDNKGEILISLSVIILIVGLLIYIVMGRLFSKKITGPVDKLINSIDNLDRLNKKELEIKNTGMFDNVFTNLRALQNRLEIAKIKELEFEKQRKEWIANISHDLKTPLSSIAGYSELMSDDKYKLSTVEMIKYSNIIMKQTKNIENLINDLSLEIKIKSMEEVLKKDHVKLNIFLKDLVISILNNYQYSHRDISFEEDGDVFFDIDKELFGRAVTNLVTNALKHSGKEAKVRVVMTKISSEHCRISIIDNGKGISKRMIDKLFVRYYRGESTDEVEGTGLGMSIAKNIVEAHGGIIKVESEIGRGTKITIELWIWVN